MTYHAKGGLLELLGFIELLELLGYIGLLESVEFIGFILCYELRVASYELLIPHSAFKCALVPTA